MVNNLIQHREYQEKIIDDNVKTDYTKLRKITENFISREEMMAIIEIEKTDPKK